MPQIVMHTVDDVGDAGSGEKRPASRRSCTLATKAEFRRILLLRTWVNKGKKEGRGY